MYNQLFIDSIGEKWAQDVLDGKRSYHFDINNINADDQRIYYCFQHYLLKAYLNGYNTNACIKYLSQMYDDFAKKPFLFYDSPLLNNRVIDKVIKEDRRQDVKGFRDAYYNQNEFDRLLKLDRSKMSNEDKRRFYAMLLTKLRAGNKYEDILRKEIEYIINSDFKLLTRMQLTFYAQYVSNWFNRNSKVHTVAKVGKTDRLRGYNSNKYVFINQKAFDSIAIMTKTICHENRHANQKYDSRNGDKSFGFEMAVKDLFIKYLNTNDYDYYRTNYRYSDTELDAENYGYSEAGLFLAMFNRKDLAQEVREERVKRLDKRNYYAHMVDENGRHVYIENFIIENLSKIIANHPEELQNYPVLANFYLPNGQRKTFKEIFFNRMGKFSDKREMYNNYIDYGITHGELDKIDIHKMKAEELKSYLDMIYWTYWRNINLFLDYYGDTPKDRGEDYKKQIEMTAKHSLYPVYKELKYLVENYDVFVNKLGNENTQSTFRDIVNKLRDLTDERLKNEVIKNNPDAIKAFDLTKGKLLELNEKVNTSYIRESVDGMSEVELDTIITTPDNKEMSLGEFLIKEAPKYSERFNHFVIDGRDYSRSELINHYLEMFYINEPKTKGM